ncbi:HAD-superfamily phosphatase, subfamily IIIC/FkbH-like domain-containing protein [Streptomyces sp. cf386]|uniref:type I polyketide synthase n=1 Tax=Streptomyces sp. cf386 TaxID=1761904 RepID=UPI0008833885|nr:type I polyketide synthase [Streptomyces sp. cf386]SDP27289.1 HAD-superfamily phosphatase, subfamily IIIC/FkbH-like domain-containing protein [Streptomyces sp. cf386]
MPVHESAKQSTEPSLTTPQDVRAWLEPAVAEVAGLDPSAVDPDRPIAELGLGSRQLVTLAAELSALTGRPLDPSLIFNHPTIAALAEAVFDDEPPRTSMPSAARADVPVRQDDAIAIISMACRFPGGADNPEALWRLLAAGEDAITEVPAGRWDTRGLHDPDPEATGKAYSLRGGYLSGIDRFDAGFFGISPREAAAMDPQQRLLLQTSWEAVERAGIVPDTLNGSSTGVYIGLYDSGYLASAALDQLDGHVGTGSASSVASGRIAYTLGLQGPAVTVDTACSSSLVALHLAARALSAGECDLALAGGASLLVTPRGHVEFSRLRGLSPSGRCSPFSADADGVVWAEGCGVVLLKRLSDAHRDGDRILAVVKGSAINQDGRSQGLSAPNGPAQERVLRAALDAAGLQPHDLDHIESHGTGTRLGDPIEGRALAAVFGPDRPADRPLGVGSLKSNIGHTQAAAGIAGVIKTVLALHHARIPASLHAETPTEHIDWADSGLRVLGEPQRWPRDPERVRRAGVSAFGISGTNAHVVLEEAPEEPTRPSGDLPHSTLFPLSARTLPALRAQAGRLLETLSGHAEPALSAVASTLAHHRTHFEHRAVVRASDRAELLTALSALTEERPDTDLTVGPHQAIPTGKLAFVFPGQGSQWPGMARDLLDRDPVFADELDRCDASLRPFTDWSVTSVLRGDAGAPSLDRVDVVQPVLFAVMVSLAAVWRARGVRPDAVVGHSQGEVAAACVAGALSLNDAAAVVALRSQALTELSGTGTMAVVALPHTEVEAQLADHDGEISVAAVNSGRSTVIAGAVDAVEALLSDLDRQQVFVRRLDVDYASHSTQVEPVRTTILDELDGVITCPTSVAWYSTVTGEPVTEELEADYWYTNLREPVRFAPTVERMAADGYRHFVELSPHPSLLTALHTIDESLVAVGSLRRDEDGPACLDRAAAELHVHGRRIDWRRLVAHTAPADLPTYAWDTQRHWIEPAASATTPGLFDRAAHPLLGVQLQSADATRWTFRNEWSPATVDWLPDHTVFGRTVVSGTTLMELCRAALAVARADTPADVTDLLLLAPLTLPDTGTVEVSVEVVTAGAVPEITVHSRPRGQEAADWTLHATASAAESAALPADEPPTWPETAEPAWDEETYERLTALGLGYGPAFQGVRQAVATGDGTVLARLALPSVAHDTADPYPVHPALLDAALHVAAALDSADPRVLLPVAVTRCVLPPGGATDLTVSVRRTDGGSGTDLTLDVGLWDADGFPAGRLEGVRLRAANPADLNSGSDSGRHLYEVAWTAVPDRPAEAPGTAWAVHGDPSDPAVAAAVRDLRTAGVQVTDEGAETVVRFWPRPTADTEPVAAAHELAVTALAELQALIALPPDEAPARTVWVTRGAIAAADGDTVPGFAQSVLWGLVRSARSEHPDLGLTLLDLDPDLGLGLDGGESSLLAAAAQSEEPELALRGGELLASRLVRARAAAASDRTAPLPTDGTVLITGGLGAVGHHIARLLAENGVPRLLLTSRQGSDDPRAVDVTAELTALGVEVEIAACDVADAAAVADVLARIGDESPLRGVVHCAGVLADGVVAELTHERLAQVLRPKVDGAVHLHRLTAGHPLDLFLLVSSAAGVVGNAGQANYAAANVLLDQLAHHRRALGLPGVSVSFGAWAGEGLAAEHADLERMARVGHRALTVDQGRELTELSLRRDTAHLVAWALDLPRLRAAAPTGALWRSLLPAPQHAPAGGRTLADRLARLPEPERAARVLALVREEAAHALGLRSADSVRPDQPLRDLGMDSVTAVDLRNRISARIGTKLPATLLFDHPTPGRLAEYLLSSALATAGRTTRKAAPVPARSSDEPVALVAMACRLPGGVTDPEGLWRLVAEGRDAVGPFPAGRWDVESLYDPDPDALGKSYAREGGFLDDIDSFDAGFFGITPKEAAAMDPQQRLLLETAWESLERAGTVPADLAGSTTGVYVGMFGSDYLSGTRLDQLDGYVGTGSALSVASGRLAYTLGLNGPALTVDTACSSSLVAVHLAAQALRAGECDLALAGGVTLMVTPQTFVEFSRLRGLSPTGRCRSFSDAADGAIWSEGAGMVVLKRLSDARRDGDRILAVLRGTAVNQDGRSQGLSAPNGPAQEQVIRRALDRSGLQPADIDYVEAHGTGTTLGDPIEANALTEVFGASRPEGRPLYLGSLKSNVGHAQAASGVVGLIKVVQSLHHETLPRTLHADTPSRHVDWADSGLSLLREETAWPASAERIRRAGVSAFGISGTNAHVIVEEAEPLAPEPTAEVPPGKHLFVLSGRSAQGLRGQAAALARHLADDSVALPDVAHTLARHRSHFERRAAIVAEERERGELRSVLGEVAAGRMLLPPHREEQTGKIAFVYAGHGGQWPGMGLDLMTDSEEFRAELTRIDEAVERRAGWSVLNALRAPEEFSPLERTEYLQPTLFAVNAALTVAWRSLGITPDAVTGHSLGEIAAAYGAGALTLDDAVAVVTGRAQTVVPVAGQGGMVSLDLPRPRVEELLAPYAGRLFVAAVNSPHSTAVSGDTEALAELRRGLDEQGIKVRSLSTPFASHTPLMDPLREDLLDRLAGIQGGHARTPLYSTVLAEPVPGDRLDPGYWYANLSEPVRFADTIRRMLDDGYRYFVELSPHPSLGSSIEAVAAGAGIDAVSIGSLRRQRGGRDVLLGRLGELYAAGHTPDWSALFPAGRRVDLPTYAFARERHWLAPAPATASGASPLLGTHVEASDEADRHLFQSEVDLRDSRFAYLTDHKVTGEVWLPGAAFLDLALEAAVTVRDGADVRLADVRFVQPLRLDESRPTRLQLVLSPAADGFREFTIASAATGRGERTRWERHVSGRVAVTPDEPVGSTEPPAAPSDSLAALRAQCTEQVDLSSVYAALAALGIEYGPAFRGLESGHRAHSTSLARLADRPAAGHLLHPAVLDAAFHTAALPEDAPEGRAFVPAGVGRLRHTGLRTTPVWVTCALRSVSGDTVKLDLRLYDEKDQLLLEAEEFELAALSPLDGALFETRWQPRPVADEPPAQGSWLILADESGVASALVERLGSSVPHVIARRGEEFAAEGPGRYVLDPADPQHLGRLLDEAFANEPPERVVQLSALDAPAIEDAATAEEAARLGCLSTLHLVRTLTDRAQGTAPRLFVVVRGSQAAGDSTQVTHPQQALAWGFGLAVAQEHPELRTTLVDLPPTDGVDALWTQLRNADDERLVALRGAGRLVPRLTRTRPDDDGHAAVTADGVHLITGGLGGLGRVVAERLVRRGARRLALLSRSAPSSEALGWIRELEERGVSVHLARADVADRAGLTAALDAVRHALGPITGVVHAAGVLDDATIANLTDERVRRVLAPKVLGTALLTELTPDAKDFVLFASAAGLLGSPGQSPYSAANAFLDAWAHHLSRTDRRALSLDWGAWSGVGMVSGSDAREAETARSGLVAFSARDGGELFDRVLGTARRQLAPLALDWELLALDPDAARTRPILADLITVPTGTPDTDDLVKKVFAATTETERAVRLEAYVRARVGEVSGGAVQVSATTALKELGLDSLMLVRLRNAFARELGVELPAATVFSAADIRGLAQALSAALPERQTTAPDDEPRHAAEVPATELHPATRDVVRLLRSAQPGMPEAAHAVGLAVRLTTPTTRETLTAILTRLTARHAALRTAVVTAAEGGPQLRVNRELPEPPLRWTAVPADTALDAADRLRSLLEPPFDLAVAPLWRFELLDGAERGQILVYGAHHAVSDLQSLLLVAGEIDAELSGNALGDAVSNRDIALLVEAQRVGGDAGGDAQQVGGEAGEDVPKAGGQVGEGVPQDRGTADSSALYARGDAGGDAQNAGGPASEDAPQAGGQVGEGAQQARGAAGGDAHYARGKADDDALKSGGIAAEQADTQAEAVEWRAAFQGSARLDLTLSRPRPQTRSYRAGSVTVPIPDGLMARISTAASRLAVTGAAFCLGTLTVLLARKRERERFVLAVPVDTRIHADAYDAVGFFGVPVPFPAEANAGERIEEVLRRTDGRLQRVLAKGAMFSDVLPVLARQGLYRANAPLVEVYFNYVRAAGRLAELEVLPAGTGYSDLDLMITVTPDAGRIRLDHNLDILDAATVTALGEELLGLLAETAEDPTGAVRTTRPTSTTTRTTTEVPQEEPAAAPAHTLALAATFALGNLPLMVETAIDESVRQGSGTTVAEAPYHHVLASLRDPSGVFAEPATTVGVVLLRAADLQRFGPVDDALLAELRTAYPAALRALAERTRKPLIVGFLPAVQQEDRLSLWERDIAAELADVPGIAILGPDDWTRHHAVEERFDERTERLAHLPFTPHFQAAVALRLAETVRAIRRPAPKVIAVDGDETLWGGVAGEIGPEAVDLTGPRALLARRLLRWQAAGALLVLVSNNDEDTVRAVLDRPDSPLKAEHFSVLSAAWDPKPTRLAEAARTLNLGLDSFLFLDDNPAEIAKMRAALPQTLSVTCPPEAELTEFLGRLWPLVPAAATAEDALRARFYEQERERDAVREQAGFEEFLEGLELEVDIRALSDADVQRAEQLVARTNQFTLRARSADGGDVARWREHGEIWTAAARDRFGDYGQIGLLAVRREGDRLDVLGWLMSCRALGRGVEERLLQWLADRAEELDCAKVRLTAERTPRNAPARRLLSALGGGDQDDERLETVVTPEHLRTFRSWRRQ